MPGSPIIRPAIESDVPAIAQIYTHHVLHGVSTFEVVPPDEPEMRRRWSTVAQAGLPWLVAELDGIVAGYAYASPYRTRAAYRFTLEDSIYLHPSFVGKGLGGALLGPLVEICESVGYRQMIAVIGGSDNIASIRLHERFGFDHIGTLRGVGFKFDRMVDTVLMQRALASS